MQPGDKWTLCWADNLSHTHTDISSRCYVLSLHIAAAINQGFMFPEVWSSFHGHVENQETATALRLQSVKTSQFVIRFDITG